MSRGGARAGAGRPRIYENGVRISVTMSRRHWEAVDLLAATTRSTPSLVLAALVEEATSKAAGVVSACLQGASCDWQDTEHGSRRDCREAVLVVNRSTLNERTYFWQMSWHGSYDCIFGTAFSYREAQERAQAAYDEALARWGVVK